MTSLSAVLVSSTTERTESIGDTLITFINSLVSCGITILNTCGNIILVHIFAFGIPIASAASICPFGIAEKPPRSISAINPPLFKLKAMTPDVYADKFNPSIDNA